MENYDDIFSGAASQPDEGAFDKESWAAKKKAERDSVYALIDQYVSDMSVDGGVFQAYLDVQARFDRYSVSNAVLIAAQCPEATRLMDFDGWKASGVYVKRGEDAITILEPGKEYTRQEDGSTGVYYNPKKVFDISPTNSRQRPAPVVARDERLLLKALINNAPCKIAVSASLPDNLTAMYQPEQNVVLVRSGMDAPALFRSVAQELTRAHLDKGGYTCPNPGFVAYSVAYMLCQRNGVDVGVFQFERIPEEYAQMEAQDLRAELGAMRDVAGEITADMNRVFEAQEKGQKHRDEGAR